MNEVLIFKTHSSFEGRMETKLGGFIRRVKQWLEQRNSFDPDHSGTVYFESRLQQLLTTSIQATAANLPMTVRAEWHGFDEEGNCFSTPSFTFVLRPDGKHDEMLTPGFGPADSAVNALCKHYFYHLEYEGMVEQDWEEVKKPLLVEAIPNADVESIIGNLLMLCQIDGAQMHELIGVVLRMLTDHRVTLAKKAALEQGVYYIYRFDAGDVMSLHEEHYVDGDGQLVPLKPTLVDIGKLNSAMVTRRVAAYKNRMTLVVL